MRIPARLRRLGSPWPWLAPSAIAAAVLAPLLRSWASGLTLVCRDSAQIYAPVRGLVGEALRRGRLPLWNPYVATGMPLFAETVHGVLHPVSIAAALLFPSDRLDPLIAGYVAAAGVGAFAMARGLGASRAAAAAAGFAYGLSGFTLSMSANLVLLAGAASLPFLVAGVRGAAAAARPAPFAAGAVAVATTALSGDIQALAFGCALALVLAAEAAGSRGVVRAAAAVALGALLGGIQLVPSWFHLPLTDRIAAPPDALEWSFAPARLLELVSPGLFTRPEEGLSAPLFVALGDPHDLMTPLALSVFLGAPVLAFAGAGAARHRVGRVLAIAALAFLWLALGHRLGAQQLLSHVPLVGTLRYAEKHVAPLGLCVAVLAGLGVDGLRAGGRAPRRLFVGAASAFVLTAVGRAFVASDFSAGALASLGVPAVDLVRAHLSAGLVHPLASLFALAALGLAASRIGPSRAASAAAALVWLQSAVAAPYALRPGLPSARYGVPPPALPAEPPGPRVHVLLVAVRTPNGPRPMPGFDDIDQLTFDFAAVAAPDFNVAQRIDNLDVDTGLQPLRWLAAQEAFGDGWNAAARRYAVTHVILPPWDEQSLARLEPVIGGAAPRREEARTGALIFAVPHRAWASFPPAVDVVASPDAAEARLAELLRERSHGAVVEAGGPLPVAAGRVLSVSRGLEEARIEAEAEADAVLVVNDAYWPGWRAEIDGEEVPILPADLLVRAVPWPAGRHVLVMSYEPREIAWGAWTSAAGAAVLLAVLVAAGVRRRRASTRAA